MTDSDGSVMSMLSGMAMSGMSGVSGTRSLHFAGAVGRLEVGGGVWGVSMGLISLGTAVAFLAGLLW